MKGFRDMNPPHSPSPRHDKGVEIGWIIHLLPRGRGYMYLAISPSLPRVDFLESNIREKSRLPFLHLSPNLSFSSSYTQAGNPERYGDSLSKSPSGLPRDLTRWPGSFLGKRTLHIGYVLPLCSVYIWIPIYLYPRFINVERLDPNNGVYTLP